MSKIYHLLTYVGKTINIPVMQTIKVLTIETTRKFDSVVTCLWGDGACLTRENRV
jgi:hypothetical protein